MTGIAPDAPIPTIDRKTHKFHIREKADKPNILLLMTDQQRFDTIQAGGYEHMHTPNLDRLVKEGCLYTHAYTPNPICLPARHNVLTGLPSRYHGFPDNMPNAITKPELPTIPRILSDHGYDTRVIGKMHFRPARRHNGFNKMELMEELPNTREEDEYAMYLKDVGWGHVQNIHGVRNLLYMVPQRSLIPEEHHGTKWVADKTISFLLANGGRQPFFLWTSWIAPHPPFDVSDRFAEMYKDADLPKPHQTKTPLAALTQENAMMGDLPDENYVRGMRDVYYGAISMVDEQVGRILDTLEQIGQLDNTLIIFTSDHGELLGDYGLYQKWNPYDSCARIPFIVRYPKKLAPGSVYESFVDLNDILPTVLDLVDLEYPADYPLPGESLFTETPTKDRDWQYVEYAEGNRRWISIRNESHKYNYYYGGGFEQLFDLVADPHETTNLLHDQYPPEVAVIRERMRAKLIEYERAWGLEGYVGDDDLKIGEPYQPHPQRNEAYPRFPKKIIDQAERAQMNDFIEEIAAAVADEPLVQLSDLDVSAWQENLGISDADVARLLELDAQKQKD